MELHLMNSQQLSLPIQEQFDELPLEPLEFDLDHTHHETEFAKTELLAIKLFKDAILQTEGNENDSILKSFVENVLPNLMKNLAGTTAKGGLFFDYLDQQVRKKPIRRDNAGDQSNVAHLLNGLFPTYRIIKIALDLPLTNQVKRFCDNIAICLYICAYLLHDFEKFPDYTSWILSVKPEFKETGEKYARKSDAPNFAKEYLIQKIKDFGLDKFLGENWEMYLNDIIWISHNAGDGQDADRGLESRGLTDYQLDSKTRGILSNLVKLSDKLASMIKHPRNINQDSISNLIGNISNHQLQFTYHSLSDNRGALTNIINNALMDIHPKEYYTPLLYLPDGVVYLAKIDAPNISIENISNQVVNKIKELCSNGLKLRTTGFNRDGKGFKFADYYWLFFDIIELMRVSVDASRKLIPSSKASSAKKRSESLLKFQNKGELPDNINVNFIEDYRIDRLAEFGDTLCRGIWREWCDRFTQFQKELPKKDRIISPNLDLTAKLLEFLELIEELPNINAIQSLKKTGGVPLDWYYLAAKYLQKNRGLDESQLEDKMYQMVNYCAEIIMPLIGQLELNDGWQDLHTYISRIITLPFGHVRTSEVAPFLTELNRYHKAKVIGRGGRENVCAMSSSSYTITEQMESATLFAPQVYSNRQILFNAQAAKRQICSIWSIEIMLRQILMNNTNATGGDFEGRKYRYLYLYPTYFFTPETNQFLHLAYSGIYRSRFDADIKRHLVSENVANFSLENYQTIDSLLIQENLNSEEDRTFKLSYPSDQPITFFFMALPPGKDATDTESWVMPAWLALALPLILDVKTVVSESPVPPFISGADFEKTVILDGVHQAIHSLIKQDEYRLDSILPCSSNSPKFSPLNALSAAYAIHLDVNRKKDGNPDWGKLSNLAKDLETSPLYVFHYLNKWLRKQDKIESIPIAKIRLYFDFYYYFEPQGETMNKIRQLTELYRRFYRAASKGKPPKANAILKPIDETADVILKVDKSLMIDDESLTDLVAGRLAKLMNNVRRGTAEGKPPLIFVDGKWKPALTLEEERQAIYEFSQYFVEKIFRENFNCDRARLAGRQLNLLRDTCEFLYRLEQDKENRQNPPKDKKTNEEESDES
jgi:CRISPR-associated protein Csc3